MTEPIHVLFISISGWQSATMERMSATAEEILDGLDEAQRAAATAVDGASRWAPTRLYLLHELVIHQFEHQRLTVGD